MRVQESSAEKKYRELFAQHTREGLSLEVIAARAGIKQSTLVWWRSELARRDRERGRVEAKAATLLPVTVRDAEPAPRVRPAPSGHYEVALNGGRVLRVPRGFDAAEVHSLVGLLEAARC